MSRYLVLRTDTPEGMNPLHAVEGYVRVEGGALVFRHHLDDENPFCMIAPGHWSDAWIDTTKEGRA